MKPAVRFLLFLFFCLLGVRSFAHAGTDQAMASAIQSVDKKAPAFHSVIAPEYKANDSAPVSQNTDRITAVDDDDEDQDLSRKHQAFIKYCAVIFLAATLPADRLSSPLFFGKPPSFCDSCKYISQRVLRI